MQTLDSSEDADLELMFAEIRRYPLLTADEERVIDGRKWAAVESLSTVFSEVADLRDETEEDPAELEASKYELNYVKLDGEIDISWWSVFTPIWVWKVRRT